MRNVARHQLSCRGDHRDGKSQCLRPHCNGIAWETGNRAPVAWQPGDKSGDAQFRASARLYVPPQMRRLTLDVASRVTRVGRAEPQYKEGESWGIIAKLSLESTPRNCVMRWRLPKAAVREMCDT